MAGVNKVILVGNLGKDPELKSTPSGQSVATFSLATTEKFSDKEGKRQERTEWHNIVVWNKMAEHCHQYLKKGRPVYIEGKISTRSWDDKEGNKHYRTEIVALNVQFLGSGQGTGNQGPADNGPGLPEEPPFSDNSAVSVAPATQGVDDDLPF